MANREVLLKSHSVLGLNFKSIYPTIVSFLASEIWGIFSYFCKKDELIQGKTKVTKPTDFQTNFELPENLVRCDNSPS